MAEDRPIKVGPGDKLRWLEHIAFHPHASEFHVRIAVAISNRVDKFSGIATVGQEWIAEKIGATGRGVRSAGDRMQALGFFEITRSKGRGLANTYRLILPPINLAEKRNGGSSFASEKRNGEAQKEERGSTKRGTAVPPLPKYYQNSSSDDDDGLDPLTVRWQSVKRRIAKTVRPGDMESWVNKLSMKRATEHEAVLVAPTRFHCAHIENGYLGDRLRDAWRAEVPSITRVILITAADAATVQQAAE